VKGTSRVAPHRHHPGWWAFLGHRLSGLALAAFLPFHFLALASVLDRARFDGLMVWTEHPLARAAEWGLVAALALHLGFGLRLLAIEFGPWSDRDPARGRWILPSVVLSALAGTAFLIGSLT
jgi:fumarate reductase subunit D